MYYELLPTAWGDAKCHAFKFDDLNELIESAVGANLNDKRGIRFEAEEFLNDDNWVGRTFGTWDRFKRESRQLWPEGMRIFEQLRERVMDVDLPKPTTVRRRPTYKDDDGDEICLDRLQLNQPFWRTTHRTKMVGKRTVTIVADVTTTASHDWKNILWRGVACTVLADRLEEAGYAVELWGAEHCCDESFQDSSNHMFACCRLKASSDPLDAATLVNATSGWFYRTAWFCAYSLAPNEWPARGLGVVSSVLPHVKWVTSDENAFVCQGVWSFEAATAWVRKTLESFLGEKVGT